MARIHVTITATFEVDDAEMFSPDDLITPETLSTNDAVCVCSNVIIHGVVKETKMKTWKYSIPAPTIWTSFDHGTVEAATEEEAVRKSLEKLAYDFKKANDALAHCDITNGFQIEFSENDVVVEECANEQWDNTQYNDNYFDSERRTFSAMQGGTDGG